MVSNNNGSNYVGGASGFYSGRDGSSGTAYIDGNLSDLRVYDDTLTAEQVVALRDILSHIPDPSKEVVELYDKVKLL